MKAAPGQSLRPSAASALINQTIHATRRDRDLAILAAALKSAGLAAT